MKESSSSSRGSLRYPRISLDECSVARTGESGCRSDSRSSVLVLVVEFSIGASLGDSLRLEWNIVALVRLAKFNRQWTKPYINPSGLLDVNLDMGLSRPTGSTADFAHTVNLTTTSLLIRLRPYNPKDDSPHHPCCTRP